MLSRLRERLFRSGTTVMAELDAIKSILSRAKPAVWLFAGDSITHGAVHTLGCRSYVEHFAERVRTELRRTRDIVINAGVDGARVPLLLAELDHLILRFKPDVVSVMIGMNDAAGGKAGREPFRTAYDELLRRLRSEAGSLILLQTPNPITPEEPLRQDLPAYVAIVRELGGVHGTALVDQYALWQAEASRLRSLLEDGLLHPNHHGHILLAHHLFRVLGIWDPASPTCRLPGP